MKIGVFDSGLGGLTILREILKVLPKYDYLYLGDNARVPYGTRSAGLIYSFTVKGLEFLFQQNCQLVILACNTATATSLKKIQQEFLPKFYPDRRVLGVVKPAVERINELRINGLRIEKVGIVGTYATINSEAFVHEIAKISPNIKVFQQACPLLVPIIEEGELNWKGLQLILKKYLRPLISKKIDSLILGCTHYGLIQTQIKKIIGKNVRIIDEGKEAAVKLKRYLSVHPEIENKLSKKGMRQYFVTDINDRYRKMTKYFLRNNWRKRDQLVLTSI